MISRQDSFRTVMCIVFGVLGIALDVQASLIHYDGFDYAIGNLNVSNTGGVWSRTGSGDTIQIVNGNLSYTGMAASTGNMVQWGGDGGVSRTDFTVISSGSIYASFLFRIDTLAPLSTTGGALAGMINAANTANPNSRVYLRRDAVNPNAYNIGVLERGSAITWAADQLTAGDTHMVVFSLDFISGAANDVARLWLDPSAATFGAGTAPAATISASGGEDASSVNRFRLIQNPSNGSAGLQSFDELRIGTTWTDVTVAAIPEPFVLSFIAVSSVGMFAVRRIFMK